MSDSKEELIERLAFYLKIHKVKKVEVVIN